MNILLCVKQVPDTERFAPDYRDDRRIDRDGSDAVINVFDSYALEVASRLKDQYPEAKLISLTMGPEKAKAVLKETLSISADKAYQLSGEAFEGIDAPATAAALAAAIKKIGEEEGGIDAVFCGKLSADGETSAVPAGIAEALGCAYVSGSIGVLAGDGKLLVSREIKGGEEKIEAGLPCVISCVKPEGEFKFPTIKRKLAANRALIPVLTADELVFTVKRATTVLNVRTPEKSASCVFFTGETPEEAAAALVGRMSADGIV